MPLRESQLIDRIRQRATARSKELRLGIGDDCAILRPRSGEEFVVTTDLSIEGTHFRRDWHPAGSVGHRCLARGLSDVAAMGARPVAAFLSLALPGDLPQEWVDGFADGFLKLARRSDCALAGGDTSESRSGVIADVMVIGAVPRGKALLRSSARVNDVIYVTGALGGSAAMIRKLSSQAGPAATEGVDGPAVYKNNRHYLPEPRISIGSYLREKKLARAMIDLSDGLSTDLAHICEESGVGAVINSNLVPAAPDADLELALHGGEDYELLFTAAANAKVPVKIHGVLVTEIGWITRGRGVYITDLKSKPKTLAKRGWEHFRR